MRRYPKQWACAVKKVRSERLSARRYRQTAKGRAQTALANARRILIGKRQIGRARTPEEARAINTYARAQLVAFKTQQREGSCL